MWGELERCDVGGEGSGKVSVVASKPGSIGMACMIDDDTWAAGARSTEWAGLAVAVAGALALLLFFERSEKGVE